MEPAYFNKFLLSVYYVPFLRLRVTVDNITSLEEAFRVKRFSVCLVVFEITRSDCRPADAKLPSNIVPCDVVSIIVDYSASSISLG